MLQILRKIPCIGRSATSYLDGQAIDSKASATVSIRRIATSNDNDSPQDRLEATRFAPEVVPNKQGPQGARCGLKASQGYAEHHEYWEGSWRPERILSGASPSAPNA